MRGRKRAEIIRQSSFRCLEAARQSAFPAEAGIQGPHAPALPRAFAPPPRLVLGAPRSPLPRGTQTLSASRKSRCRLSGSGMLIARLKAARAAGLIRAPCSCHEMRAQDFTGEPQLNLAPEAQSPPHLAGGGDASCSRRGDVGGLDRRVSELKSQKILLPNGAETTLEAVVGSGNS
jgi:hypothetical protein